MRDELALALAGRPAAKARDVAVVPRRPSRETVALDFLVMEARDRLTNLGLFVAAGILWLLVALVVTTRDPRIDVSAGYVGALLIGLASGLTVTPLVWLAAFARNRRIAYAGSWTRAVRRGGWVAVVTAVFVVLRLQQLFVPPLAIFILALVVLAEVVLSIER